MKERRKSKQKYWLIGLSVFALAVIGVLLGGYLFVLSPKFNTTNLQYIYIFPEDNIQSVSKKIYSKGGNKARRVFKILNWCYQLENKFSGNSVADTDKLNIRVGRYAVKPNEKVIDVYRKIKTGAQSPMFLTIPSTRDMGRLAKSIAKQVMIKEAEISDAISRYIYNNSNDTVAFNPLALFIPDTCEVYWNISGEQLMERMQKEYDKFWSTERRQKANNIGMSVYEVMTLASIVDEETAKDDEKDMIAGLYINRIRKNIPLQADPTVKYALQDFGLRRIMKEHLKVQSPYNTYINTGLPPGPIRIPSKAGIDAVLNHVKHNYIYMCAKEDFSGRHNFAVTYSEHMANARRYWAELNRRKIYK